MSIIICVEIKYQITWHHKPLPVDTKNTKICKIHLSLAYYKPTNYKVSTNQTGSFDFDFFVLHLETYKIAMGIHKVLQKINLSLSVNTLLTHNPIS